MALTASAEVVASAIKTAIDAQVGALGIASTFYGDQAILPKTPAVCISPGNKTREWQGASLTTMNTFETYVFVYYGKVQDVQQNLHAAQTLADAIEPVVQADVTLGGIVIGTLCIQNEPGMINKAGSLMMGNRMTFQSFSKTRLP
jgi:hypothetical protein